MVSWLMRSLVTVLVIACSGCHVVLPLVSELQGKDAGPPDGTSQRDVGSALADGGPAMDGPLPPALDAQPGPDLPLPPNKDKGGPIPKDGGLMAKEVGAMPKDMKQGPDLQPCCVNPACCPKCVMAAAGTKCTLSNGYPGECDGNGTCNECLVQGDQCDGAPTPCCSGLSCSVWPTIPGFLTCGP
jgi:hypothetical protein